VTVILLLGVSFMIYKSPRGIVHKSATLKNEKHKDYMFHAYLRAILTHIYWNDNVCIGFLLLLSPWAESADGP